MIYLHSMDQDLRKLIEENNKLLLENLELSRQNNKKIKKIQSHIRRTMVGKTLYWILIIGITFGAYHFSKPYIDNVRNTYNDFRENINQSSEFINNPGSVFKNLSIFEKNIDS